MKQITVIILAMITMQVSAQKTKLNGRWLSVTTENLGASWGIRDFTFDEDKWELTFTMYGDSAKQFPLFSFEATGNFSVGKKSKSAKLAHETDFYFTKKYLTALTEDPVILQQLGFSNCNLKKGIKTDITVSGCSFIPSVTNYPKEFDLTSLQGDKLFLGMRPADGNMGTAEKRPTSLGYALVKTK